MILRAKELLIVTICLVGFAEAAAGWIAYSIHEGPDSEAIGIRNSKVVGRVGNNAVVWTLGQGGFVNLGPGVANRTDGVQQSGYIPAANTLHASVWSGTSNTLVNLNPPGIPNFWYSIATSVFAGQQCGSVFTTTLSVIPGFWTDSAASWTSLLPPGASAGRAEDLHFGEVVGAVSFGVHTQFTNAIVWYNSPTNFVNLHPLAASSSALGTYSGHQVGWHTPIGSSDRRASRWQGSAASHVNMHPSWANESYIIATYTGKQAGVSNLAPGGPTRATAWFNTPESAVDLHEFLPNGYTSSVASGIWTDFAGVYTYVVGSANHSSFGRLPFVWRFIQDPTVSASLTLSDTSNVFASNRSITFSVIKDNVPIGSGVLARGVTSGAISFTVPAGQTGPATLVLDGSSFLRKVVPMNLSGNNMNLGLIIMKNGDADLTGEVDAADIDAVIADYGDLSIGSTDLDVSGEVDASDIDIAIQNFGESDD